MYNSLAHFYFVVKNEKRLLYSFDNYIKKICTLHAPLFIIKVSSCLYISCTLLCNIYSLFYFLCYFHFFPSLSRTILFCCFVSVVEWTQSRLPKRFRQCLVASQQMLIMEKIPYGNEISFSISVIFILCTSRYSDDFNVAFINQIMWYL